VLAWFVSVWVGSSAPVFASVTAMACVQLGLAWSVRDAASVGGATLAGLLVAHVVVSADGHGVVSVFIAGTVALVVGRLFGIDLEKAVGAAVSSMFAVLLGDGLTTATVSSRGVAIVVGVIVGVGVSAAPLWGHPVRVASDGVRRIALDVAVLWRDLGAVAEAGIPVEEAATVLARSRVLIKQREELSRTVEAAIGHARLSPVSSAEQTAHDLSYMWTQTTHGVEVSNAVARGLFDSAGTLAGKQLAEDEGFAATLLGAADLFEMLSRDEIEGEAFDVARDSLLTRVQDAGRALKDNGDTKMIMLGGHLLAGVRTVATGAGRSTGAVSDEIPVDDVVKPVPRLKRKKDFSAS
jgi:hypothetical protein